MSKAEENTTRLMQEYEHRQDLWRAMAIRWSRNAVDADDIVAEAVTRIIEAFERGTPYPDNMNAYALRTIHNVFVSSVTSSRARRSIISDDAVTVAIEESSDAQRGGAREESMLGETELMRRALGRLPKNYRELLWLTEVEGYTPTELARQWPRQSANAITLGKSRARKALRLAYLMESLHPAATQTCGTFDEDLAASATGTLSPRARRRLDRHLVSCASCQERGSELLSLTGSLSGSMSGLLIPAMVELVVTGHLSPARSARLGGRQVSLLCLGAAATAAVVFALLGVGPASMGLAPEVGESGPARPDLGAAAAVVPSTTESASTPTPRGPAPSAEPTPNADPEPSLDPGTETKPIVFGLESADLSAGTVRITLPDLDAPQTVTVSTPEGIAFLGVEGWTCDGSSCTATESTTSCLLRFEITQATSGTLGIVVTADLAANVRGYGAMTVPVSVHPL